MRIMRIQVRTVNKSEDSVRSNNSMWVIPDGQIRNTTCDTTHHRLDIEYDLSRRVYKVRVQDRI